MGLSAYQLTYLTADRQHISCNAMDPVTPLHGSAVTCASQPIYLQHIASKRVCQAPAHGIIHLTHQLDDTMILGGVMLVQPAVTSMDGNHGEYLLRLCRLIMHV